MMRLALAIVLSSTAFCFGARAQPAEIFARAESDFELGVASVETGRPDEARDHFRRAALAYEQVAAEGVDSPSLRANAGNAWLLAGRPGEAVLAYRRALRLDPAHPAARAGLAEARSRIGVQTPVAPARRLSDRAIGLIGALGPVRLLWLGALAWIGAWALIGARLLGRVAPWAGPAAAACAGAALLALGAIGWAAWTHRATGDAVILAERVEARLGPGAAAYEPAFDAPLAAGMEVRILDRQAGWAHVSLLDGRSAWVPADALALVHPGA
ncbi:MAG: hypothetical protein ACF8R7_11325 [Phycisphaerales bacterium JB039]